MTGLAVAPAGASATTFGANLGALAANNTQTCGGTFNSASCLAYAINPSSYAPFSGVVNTVRVKTGDFAQGPMQVVVLRSYYQNNLGDPGHPYFACCFVQEYSQVFTPGRNTTTSVHVTLGMVEDPTPPSNDGSTNAKDDFLGLSVLNGNVVFPGSLQDSQAFAGFYAPAPQEPDKTPNGLGGFTTESYGFTPLLSADIDSLDGGGGGRAPVGFPATDGRLVGGNTAAVPLVCRLTTACNGTLTLQNRAGGGRRAAIAAKPKVYGRTQFTIAAKKAKAVRVSLNKAGRKLAKHKHRLTLYAVSVIGYTRTAHKVTLQAP